MTRLQKARAEGNSGVERTRGRAAPEERVVRTCSDKVLQALNDDPGRSCSLVSWERGESPENVAEEDVHHGFLVVLSVLLSRSILRRGLRQRCISLRRWAAMLTALLCIFVTVVFVALIAVSTVCTQVRSFSAATGSRRRRTLLLRGRLGLLGPPVPCSLWLLHAWCVWQDHLPFPQLCPSCAQTAHVPLVPALPQVRTRLQALWQVVVRVLRVLLPAELGQVRSDAHAVLACVSLAEGVPKGPFHTKKTLAVLIRSQNAMHTEFTMALKSL